MRCRETRTLLEDRAEDQLEASAREHLQNCQACQVYARDWRLIRTGLRLLSGEPVPRASTGFVARLTRGLVEPSLPARAAAQFWELVGRRMILAGSLLALTVVMALLLPPSGPWRSPVGLDLSLLQVEVASENDPVVPEDIGSSPGVAPNVSGSEDRKGRE
jgi:hypothetical protein